MAPQLTYILEPYKQNIIVFKTTLQPEILIPVAKLIQRSILAISKEVWSQELMNLTEFVGVHCYIVTIVWNHEFQKKICHSFLSPCSEVYLIKLLLSTVL